MIDTYETAVFGYLHATIFLLRDCHLHLCIYMSAFDIPNSLLLFSSAYSSSSTFTPHLKYLNSKYLAILSRTHHRSPYTARQTLHISQTNTIRPQQASFVAKLSSPKIGDALVADGAVILYQVRLAEAEVLDEMVAVLGIDGREDGRERSSCEAVEQEKEKWFEGACQ